MRKVSDHDRTQGIRNPVWHEVWLVTFRLEIADECANGGIAIAGPRHVMQLRAEQPIEKGVARGLVFRCRRCEPAVIDGQVTGEAKLGGNRRDLPLAIRLHDAARDDGVGAV